MFAGWNTLDFIVTAALFWFVALPVAIAGFFAFLGHLDQTYGPEATVYDFTTEARKRKGQAA